MIDNLNKEKYFALVIMIIMLLSLAYLFKDYLYIILVASILALSTAKLDGKLMLWLVNIGKKFNINFIIRHRSIISSAILTLSFLLIIFTPLMYFIFNSYKSILPYANIDNLQPLINKIMNFISNLPEPISFLQEYVNLGLKNFEVSNIDMDFVKKGVLLVGTVVSKINTVVIDIFLILTFYFLINTYGLKLKNYIYSLMPISHDKKNILYFEFSNTSSVVLYSIIFTMFAQGIAFGVLMLFFDYSALYTGLMAGFFSVIPIVGTTLVYVPISLMEIANGNITGAIIILLYSIIFMGTIIDNVFKIIFIKYINKKLEIKYALSEIMVLLSMIAAIGVIGFWGIIVGPAIAALTIASLKLYKETIVEYKDNLN